MNTQEFTDTIAREHGLSKAFSTRLLQTVLGTIRSELKQGHTVRLRNFGTFQATKSHGKLRAKFDDSKNFFQILHTPSAPKIRLQEKGQS